MLSIRTQMLSLRTQMLSIRTQMLSLRLLTQMLSIRVLTYMLSIRKVCSVYILCELRRFRVDREREYWSFVESVCVCVCVCVYTSDWTELNWNRMKKDLIEETHSSEIHMLLIQSDCQLVWFWCSKTCVCVCVWNCEYEAVIYRKAKLPALSLEAQTGP